MYSLRPSRPLAFITRYFAFAIFIAISVNTNGEERRDADSRFLVEVIAFAHINAGARSDEQWPSDPALPELSRAILPISGTQGAFVEQLAADALTLSAVRDRLERLRSYQPILHTGWRQSIWKRRQAIAVRVRGGETIDVGTTPTRGTSMASNRRQTASTTRFADLKEQTDYGSIGQAAHCEIDGKITLRKGRYMHIDADVVYRHPLADAAARPPERYGTQDTSVDRHNIRTVRLTQSRRVQEGEIHYFDHPLFGLIVSVRKQEPPDSSKATESQ